MHKCVVMFSGGLDSVIAAHLLKEQGLEVVALNFVLPFYSGIGRTDREVKTHAEKLGVRLRMEEEGEEFLDMIKEPSFGFGKNANPCVDCRIYRLAKARQIMEEENAVCLATGEVVGQRPMSQRMDCLYKVERLSDLKGKLLRPLSAKLLTPTDVEQAGIVDREKLLCISGRSRKVQLAYARQHGLSHASPAGGCLLTNTETAVRYNDLIENNPDFALSDFKLIAWGRHFRTSPYFKVIVSRNESENDVLEKLCSSGMYLFSLRDVPGPLALGVGEPTEADLRLGASAVVRFSKVRKEKNVAVMVGSGGKKRILEVGSAGEEELENIRVSSSRTRVVG
ncbi:MAG: hypothetical protein ACLFVQ_09620 [Chitinispirillaceae bacterium]